MLGALLFILSLGAEFGEIRGEEETNVPHRIQDGTMVERLAEATVQKGSEQLVAQIANILADPEIVENVKTLKLSLRKLIKNQEPSSPKLPGGIVNLLKAKLTVKEKENILLKVLAKVNQVENLETTQEPPSISTQSSDFPLRIFPAVHYEAVPQSDRLERLTRLGRNYEVIEPKDLQQMDFSSCERQVDGSCCISGSKVTEQNSRGVVRDCYHKNVTNCYDSYVTKYVSVEEKECQEIFHKNCVIDFMEVPVNYTINSCITPLVKDCSGYVTGKDVCKVYSQTWCNTTYDEEWRPSTTCSKEPMEICAPEKCSVVDGPEQCKRKTLTTTSLKPVETCDLQPEVVCRTVSKPVPRLVRVPNCYTEEKEVCRNSLGNPKPKLQTVQTSWCRLSDGRTVSVPFPVKSHSAREFSLSRPAVNLSPGENYARLNRVSEDSSRSGEESVDSVIDLRDNQRGEKSIVEFGSL